jgi:3-oxoacyl-[acyl-carrier protein] reductase
MKPTWVASPSSPGAARGFGQASCLQLAVRGATVVAVDLNDPTETLTLLKEAGHESIGLRAEFQPRAGARRRCRGP